MRESLPRSGAGNCREPATALNRKWLNPASGDITVVPDWGRHELKVGTVRGVVRQLVLGRFQSRLTSQAAGAKLAGAFAAHQKLESLCAAPPGEPDTGLNTEPEPAPTHLGRYVIGARAGSTGAAILGAGAFDTVYWPTIPS